MERALKEVPLDEARALIARAWRTGADGPMALGTVTLRPHQRDAVRRLRTAMREFGGALLADGVGLGKTFVAAAIIQESSDALVVCPASLREMWRRALARCGAAAAITSYSALSRGREPITPRLLVLDEAHHARTPTTRRYTVLARLARSVPVLALSATPVHNARADIAAVLALFLGARAWAMSDAEIARCVVRREHADLPDAPLPALEPARWVTFDDDEAMLDRIVALPPPVPPSGGGDGGVLVTWSLVRQWASSRAALRGALRRRLARAAALEHALEAGRYPTARELTAWTAGDDVVQLAFPSLMAAAHDGAAALRAAIEAHRGALRELAGAADADPSADARRAERLREIRRAHPGERIVAFSQYADTVHALLRALAPDGGAAALTAQGARVAGGAISRRETLARFAPRALGAAPPRAADRIDLLLTTDLLSEGLDLGDASIVVHLDLPWTPARLEQRVGRSRRLGAPHERTRVYAFAPPAAAERLLEVERRLRAKLQEAGRVIGIAETIVPSFSALALEPSAARTREAMHRLIERWARTSAPAPPVIAAGRGGREAILLVAENDGTPVLAGATAGVELDEDPARVLEVLESVAGARPAVLTAGARALADRAAARWLAHDAATGAVGDRALFQNNGRRLALRRIAAITARAAHERRPLLASLAAAARRIVSTPFGLGAERVLDTLAGAPMADEAWLRALAEFGAIHAAAAPHEGGLTVLALIVLTAE